MINRIPTGIEALDRLIEGGIPKATSGTVITDKRSPGSFFGHQILWNSLQRGLNCAYFHTKYSSKGELIDEMKGNGWDPVPFIESGRFQISDYVELAQLRPEEQQSIEFGRDARKVEGRVISASKLAELTQKATYDFAIYDDIDLLLRKLEKPQFIEWAGTVAKLQKEKGGVALALVYQWNLPSDVMGLVERLGSDCTIELRTNETPDGQLQHYFRVTRMKGTNIGRHGWIAYLRGKEGIIAA